MSYLPSSELADLVGCQPNQRATMLNWPAANRWRHEVDSKGMPKVARAHHDKKMGITDEKAVAKFPKNQTSTPSRKEHTGIDRLYNYTGARKISFYYQYADGTNETLASAVLGDRKAITDAELTAKRKAIDIQQGKVIVGSVADMIDRFELEVAPTHYRDQSKDGLAVRKSAYNNLKKLFGKMTPRALTTHHGYQFLKARAAAGAPAKANKELSQLSMICNYAVKDGVMDANPFNNMMQNVTDKSVRTTSRRQVLRFYLWAIRQDAKQKNMGCAAMFTYLTGFRAAEVRPYQTDGFSNDGVRVISAKRKKGQNGIIKVLEWSTRLHVVVARAKQTHGRPRDFLFATSSGSPYTRSGWGSTWVDVMFEYIASFDAVAATALRKKVWEVEYKAYDKVQPETSLQSRLQNHVALRVLRSAGHPSRSHYNKTTPTRARRI